MDFQEVIRQFHSDCELRGLAGAKPARELPLEVAILLDVFARIEVRRQARLRDEQQGEVN